MNDTDESTVEALRGKPRIVVLTGPTASGKSALALKVAGALGGEIVSADSMQVYRGLDIGTAKPTEAERAQVRHHLIDIIDVEEPYNAGRYREDAAAAIERIRERGNPVLVVGGTALYIKVLLEGLLPGAGRDDATRQALERRWDEGKREALYRELVDADPEAAARLHPNDRTRIVRALEVYLTTGRPISELQRAHSFSERPYDALMLGAEVDREELYRRINVRVDEMLAAGWVEEVERVLASGGNPELAPMKAIGYRELCAYLSGELGMAEAVEAIKRSTRQFAKRQLTWFRKMPLRPVNPHSHEKVIAEVKNFLQTKPLGL